MFKVIVLHILAVQGPIRQLVEWSWYATTSSVLITAYHESFDYIGEDNKAVYLTNVALTFYWTV